MWRQHRVGCRHACTADIQHRYRLELDIKNIRIARRPVRDQGCHHVDLGPVKEWGYPATEEYRDRWPQYPAALQLCEFAPDLVLIDGRFRVACAAQAWKLMSPEARLVVHDYRSRPGYHEIETLFVPEQEAEDLTVFRKKPSASEREATALLEKHSYNVA